MRANRYQYVICLLFVALSVSCGSSQQEAGSDTVSGEPAVAGALTDIVRIGESANGGNSGSNTSGEPGDSAASAEPELGASIPDPVVLNSIFINDTNVSGGGFQSDVTITDNGLTVYSAADVSGVFKSVDGGLRFESRNQGLESSKIASLAITPDNNQILYVGSGDKGSSGGLFRSVDSGETWRLTGAGASARFAGNHSASGDPLPGGHPRSNGNLIVVDQGDNATTFTDDIVIAGTYKDGVRILTEGGETEALAVYTSGFVRAIARNPTLPNVVFAAIQFSDISKNGIYRIDYTSLSSPISTFEYAALRPEGLAVLSNGHVYAAIGSGGIAKYDGNTWSIQNNGLSINNENRQWTAVAGYVADNNDVVYAGTNNLGGTTNNNNYSTIWRTVDGGNSWSPLVDADTNVVDTIHGQQYDWWFRIDAFRQAGLGRSNSVVSSIDIDRGPDADLISDDIIYVSGRGGIWKSDDGGNAWKPAVYNMQATANNGVAVNLNNPQQVVIANTDFVVLQTTNSFESDNMSRDKPGGAESRAYDAIFDVVSNEFILGVGDRDTNNPGGGEVFVKSATSIGISPGSGWTNTQLQSAPSWGGGRVRAVSYGYHDGSNATSQTLLAAVEGEGVYRRHNGVWSRSSGITLGSTNRSNFVWPDSGNSGVVYLIDLSTGLYRSSDGGQSWNNIWPGMTFRNNDFYNSGYIAADNNDPATLYLSVQGDVGSPIGTDFKVYRITGANTGIISATTSSNVTDITKHTGDSIIRRSGPIVLSPDGSLWLTEQQDSRNSVDAALYVMENPQTDASFTDVTTNEYRNAAISPSGIDISSDGYVYISQNGIGILKISLPCHLDSRCN